MTSDVIFSTMYDGKQNIPIGESLIGIKLCWLFQLLDNLFSPIKGTVEQAQINVYGNRGIAKNGGTRGWILWWHTF